MKALENLKLAEPFIKWALLIAVIILMADKCYSDYVPKVAIAPVEQKKNDAEVKKEKHFSDSVNKVIARKDHELDSVKAVAKYYRKALNSTIAKASESAAGIEMAIENKDTVGFKENCLALAAQVPQLQRENKEKDRAYDKAIELNESVVSDMQNKLDAKEELNDSLKNSNSRLAKENISTTKDLNKANKKNSKRWAVGPSFNYAITPDGKTGFSVGASVTFILFKF